MSRVGARRTGDGVQGGTSATTSSSSPGLGGTETETVLALPPPRSLEERFELLEARFTQPMLVPSSVGQHQNKNHHQQQQQQQQQQQSAPTRSASLSQYYHPDQHSHSNLSEHSFGFAASNQSNGTTATAATATASNRHGLHVRSKRRSSKQQTTGQSLTSLEVVSRAAALHIQKVVASSNGSPLQRHGGDDHSQSQSSILNHSTILGVNFGNSNSAQTTTTMTSMSRHSSGSSTSNGSIHSSDGSHSQQTLLAGNRQNQRRSSHQQQQHQQQRRQQQQLQLQRVVAESPPVVVSPHHHNTVPSIQCKKGLTSDQTTMVDASPLTTNSVKPNVARTLLASSVPSNGQGTTSSSNASGTSTKRKSVPKRKVSSIHDNLGSGGSISSPGTPATMTSPTQTASSPKRPRTSTLNGESESSHGWTTTTTMATTTTTTTATTAVTSTATKSPKATISSYYNNNAASSSSNLCEHSRSNQGGIGGGGGTSSRQSVNNNNSNNNNTGTMTTTNNTSNSKRAAPPPPPPSNNKLIHDFFSSATHKRNSKEQRLMGHTRGAAATTTTAASGVGQSIDAPTSGIGTTTKDAVVSDQSGTSMTSSGPSSNANSLKAASMTTSSSSSQSDCDGGVDWQAQCTKLQQELQDRDEQLKAVINNKTILHTALQAGLERTKRELTSLQESTAQKTAQMYAVVEDLVRWRSTKQAKDVRATLAADGARLGRIVYARAGMRALESWEEGYATKDLQQRKEDLKRKRQTLIERQDALLVHRRDPTDETSHPTNLSPLDVQEARESLRMHMESLRREEQDLSEEEQALNDEKGTHIRALKLVASEEASRFRARPKLHDRYVLDRLLGKGGFSEVWRAYDLKELRDVAVKIHQLDSRWPDSKKENYTKHVSREYEIHRNVRHPRIVSLYDVFEIDNNSFATVLEVCNGIDLDTLLKSKKRLPERQARAILLQILSGMQYLSQPSGSRMGIIHYDLKPGNILFDEYGDAKITDFGLSKIVDAPDPEESMELTSQGAGTYWYLPPECFVTGEQVRISNKVDVWSIGVIYYQMLYGRRPFGEGKSQDKLLSEHTMLNAHQVHLPDRPAVSDLGKDFIRQCLTYDQAFRPTMAQLCENSYILQQPEEV